MATVERDGVHLYYEQSGAGPPVVFVGDAGYGAWQWGWQHAALSGAWSTLVFDHRGTGASDAPPGPYAAADLVADLEAVLADAGCRRAHLVGAGLGGLVALAHARTHGRARTLTLLSTTTHGTDVDVLACRDLETATSESFRDAQPDVLAGIEEWRSEDDAADAEWRAQAAAVARFDARDWLHEVTVPALVAHGTADAVWPVERGRALAGGLPRGEFLPLEGAGHLAWVEHSRVVNDHLLGFLDEHGEE